MHIKKIILLSAFLCYNSLFCSNATGNSSTTTPIIYTDLSDNQIEIGHDFKGGRVTLFGNKSHADSKIIAVLRGNNIKKSVIKKKKHKTGLWISSENLLFKNVPSMYVLISAHALELTMGLRRAANFGLGLNSLNMLPINNNKHNENTLEYIYDAQQAIIKQQVFKGLFYQKQMDSKSMLESGYLFKCSFWLPHDIYPGRYIVSTFLILDGDIYAINVDPVRIVPIGLSAIVEDIARENKVLYYFYCVAMAACLGGISFVIVSVFSGNKINRRIR